MTVLNLKKYNLKLCCLLGCLFIFSPVTVNAHDGHGNEAPWSACESKKLADPCRFESNHSLYKGSCRAMNKVLMCVRNQPIESLVFDDDVNRSSGSSSITE